MNEAELTFWHNEDGSFSLARRHDDLVLGRYRDDDPDGWRAWLGSRVEELEFIGLFEDDDEAIEAIAEAARDTGLI